MTFLDFVVGFVIYVVIYSFWRLVIWEKFFGDDEPVPPNMQRSYHSDCTCISGAMMDNPKCPHHGDKE